MTRRRRPKGSKERERHIIKGLRIYRLPAGMPWKVESHRKPSKRKPKVEKPQPKRKERSSESYKAAHREYMRQQRAQQASDEMARGERKRRYAPRPNRRK